MATEIATAYVQVVPTTQGISDKLKQELTGETTEGIGGTLGDGLLSGLGTSTTMLVGMVATAAATAAKTIWQQANVVGEYGDNIDKASQKLGISAQAYQEWGYILEHNGSSIDSLTTGMKTLQLAADQNKGAFEQLGISQQQLATMTPEELFGATIEGLQNVSDTVDRTALASDLFGRSAMELGPLLNMTAEETEEMRQRFGTLGGMMSDESVKNAAAFEDALTDLRTAWDGVKRSFMEPFLPVLTDSINWLAEAISRANPDIEALGEAGKLGDGHEIEDYAAHVDELRQEWEELDAILAQPRDPEMYSIDEWTEMQDRYSDVVYELQGAEAELAEQTALANEQIAMQAEYGEESAAMAEAAREATIRMTEAYQEAYDAAYDSITGQIGLFNEFKAELDEDISTVSGLLDRWNENTQALQEYSANLQLAEAYGVAPELLAALADGSAESAAVLAEIVSEIQAAGDGSAEAAALVDDLNESFTSMKEAESELADIAAFAQMGELNGQAYADGLASTEGEAGAAGDLVAAAGGNPLSAMSGLGYGWGSDMTSNFASGMMAGLPAVTEAANAVAAAASGPLKHSVPKEGPLMHDDEWGYHMMDNFIAGIRGSEDGVKQALNSALDVGGVSFRGDVGGDGGLVQVTALLTTYLPQILERGIRLDDGTLIGRYAGGFDTELGTRRNLSARRLAV